MAPIEIWIHLEDLAGIVSEDSALTAWLVHSLGQGSKLIRQIIFLQLLMIMAGISRSMMMPFGAMTFIPISIFAEPSLLMTKAFPQIIAIAGPVLVSPGKNIMKLMYLEMPDVMAPTPLRLVGMPI